MRSLSGLEQLLKLDDISTSPPQKGKRKARGPSEKHAGERFPGQMKVVCVILTQPHFTFFVGARCATLSGGVSCSPETCGFDCMDLREVCGRTLMGLVLGLGLVMGEEKVREGREERKREVF